MEEERRWDELNTDCLVNVLERVGMESLILDVPLVCKSWYRASLNPACWKILYFPQSSSSNEGNFRNKVMVPFWFKQLKKRVMDVYRVKKFSITGFVKLVVSRSRRSAVKVLLPTECTLEALEFVSKECPALKSLIISTNLVQDHVELIPKLISKWKYLQKLDLGILGLSCRLFLQEILIQISINCKNFNELRQRGCVYDEQASAITTFLPKIKYLRLNFCKLPRKSLLMILEGCNDLLLLDAIYSVKWDIEEDEEILKMASHIKTFRVSHIRTLGKCKWDGVLVMDKESDYD